VQVPWKWLREEFRDEEKHEERNGIMAVTIGILLYLVFCLLTGLCGSKRRIGFLGAFILSLFITPVVMLIVLLMTGPSREIEWHRRPQSD
jgi:hypothetical protein